MICIYEECFRVDFFTGYGIIGQKKHKLYRFQPIHISIGFLEKIQLIINKI